MDWQFSRRALRFQPNIFNVLKDLKGERLARGEWVCDLSVGTPDFPVAEHIRARGLRPAENGLGSGGAGIVVRPDVSRMSRADRAALAARAERGERVKLSL